MKTLSQKPSLNSLDPQEATASIDSLASAITAISGPARAAALALLTIGAACSPDEEVRGIWVDRVDPEQCLKIASDGEYEPVDDNHQWSEYYQSGPTQDPAVQAVDGSGVNLSFAVNGKGAELIRVNLDEYAVVAGCSNPEQRVAANTAAFELNWADETIEQGTSSDEIRAFVGKPVNGFGCDQIDIIVTRDYENTEENCKTVSYSVESLEWDDQAPVQE